MTIFTKMSKTLPEINQNNSRVTTLNKNFVSMAIARLLCKPTYEILKAFSSQNGKTAILIQRETSIQKLIGKTGIYIVQFLERYLPNIFSRWTVSQCTIRQCFGQMKASFVLMFQCNIRVITSLYPSTSRAFEG